MESQRMKKTYSSFNSITIDGVFYDKQALEKNIDSVINSKDFDEWGKSIWLFILEWIDDKDYILANTSGSTGKPKPIKIAKQYMVNSAKATGKYFDLQKGNKGLLCLPIHYIAGKMMLVRAFVLGLDLICVKPTSNPIKQISKGIDFAAMIPLQVEKTLERVSLNQIKKLIIGGAAVSSSLLSKVQKIPTICFATYGMTETVTHIAVKQLNGENKTPYYKTLENVSISLDNRDCLVINAPMVTENVITTNDVVKLISDTEFEWLGRYDNVVNSGGVKIHPEEIERKISKLIKKPFFISSRKHESLGEELILIIEDKEQNLDKVSLNKDLALVLDKYEKPKKIFCIKAFIQTASGKIKRFETQKLIG